MATIAAIAIRALALIVAAAGITVAIVSAIEVGRGYAALFAANRGTVGCWQIAARGIASTAVLVACAALGVILVMNLAFCWGIGWEL